MTFAKVFIMVIIFGVFAFTCYKLVMQIKEYKQKKVAKSDIEKKTENTTKEV